MKLIFKNLLFLGCVYSLLSNCSTPLESSTDMNETSTQAEVHEVKAERELKHVVIFKFKDEASPEDVKKLNDAFLALPKAIPVIQHFEWGLNDSPENFHQGFTHCYILSFKSEEDRDSVYTPHPQHQAFVQSLQPHLEKVFVVDFWTNP